MTALNDAERAVRHAMTEGPKRAVPMRSGQEALDRTSRYSPTWLPSWRFVAAVIAIGGMQLMATMDGTIAIVALPKIQNELSLSDAGRSEEHTSELQSRGHLV